MGSGCLSDSNMQVSVYITSYNQKNYLIEAIESALAQTLRPCQIIIVDDCSNDGSQDVIADYHSRFPNLITPIYHSQNTGVTQSRIDALMAVRGDYVTYMDGDDRFIPTKIEKESELLRNHSEAQIAFSNNFYMNEDGVRTGVWAESEKPAEGYVFCKTFARDFPKFNLFRMELINYSAWKEVGFHDPHLFIYEDFDMRIRLSKRFRTVYVDEPLSEIRCHTKGLSHSKAVKHFEALDYIYRKNLCLLDDVSKPEKDYVMQRIGKWIAEIGWQAVDESLKEGKRLQAVKYLAESLRYNPSMFRMRTALRIIT